MTMDAVCSLAMTQLTVSYNPTCRYRERRKTMKQDHRVSVRFPLRPDYLVSEHNIQERMVMLQCPAAAYTHGGK